MKSVNQDTIPDNPIALYQESCREVARVTLRVLEGLPQTPEVIKCRERAEALLNSVGTERPTMPTNGSI